MFITIEGLDGSGKSTVLDAITDRYPSAVTTSEPSTLWTGEQVRRCLSDEDVDALTDFYFFMGDRVHHIQNKVRPADEQGKLVISDRYADSTRAYQPVGLTNAGYFDSQTQAKIFIEETMAPWNYEPDLTIYLDISVDTALHRCDATEKYEKREVLEEVKENYDALVDSKDRMIRVDAEQSAEEVKAEVLGRIDLPSPDRI